MSESINLAVYWDSSAILSALFKDKHSEEAIHWAGREGIHLVSTLACAEVCAVISRIRRERLLANVLVDAAFEAFETGPWRKLFIWPDYEDLKFLASRWPLRGADLWHLATAKKLQRDIPELTFLSFDNKLNTSAAGEKMI